MQPKMTVASINVGLIQSITHNEKVVRTAIYKKPVTGPVNVRTLGLDGDQQADKRYHGGEHMAVYGYTAENYAYWRRELGDAPLPFATFGENLTIAGLDEADVCIGDRFRIGAMVELEVSVPRAPCSKLAMVMGDVEFPKRFLAAGRVGFYMRVVREGVIETGDPVTRTKRDDAQLSIGEIVRLKYFEKQNDEGARRAAAVEALAPQWREHFQKRIAKE